MGRGDSSKSMVPGGAAKGLDRVDGARGDREVEVEERSIGVIFRPDDDRRSICCVGIPLRLCEGGPVGPDDSGERSFRRSRSTLAHTILEAVLPDVGQLGGVVRGRPGATSGKVVDEDRSIEGVRRAKGGTGSDPAAEARRGHARNR